MGTTTQRLESMLDRLGDTPAELRLARALEQEIASVRYTHLCQKLDDIHQAVRVTNPEKPAPFRDSVARVWQPIARHWLPLLGLLLLLASNIPLKDAVMMAVKLK